MENQFGKERTMALEKYHGVLSLTREQAKEILLTVFPEAPEVELKRAVLLCASYQLNPLMGHVFLVPFKGRDKTSWATVIGIKAKRLLASRKRVFSYLDDSPRIMTEKEQIKVFGKLDAEHIVAITVLEDPATGATARGYGKWERSKEPYGTDKGNSRENMAFIRSESQALDRLCPGEMPVGIGAIDEQFISEASLVTTKVIEVEPEPSQLEAVTPTSEAGKAEPAPPAKPKRDPATITNLGELYKACNQDFGMKTRAEVWKELGVNSQEDITETPAECYCRVAAVRQ